MEGDVLGGSQESGLQHEQVHMFAEGLEIVVFCQNFGFWWDGEGDIEVTTKLCANGGDEIADVVFWVEFFQIYV